MTIVIKNCKKVYVYARFKKKIQYCTFKKLQRLKLPVKCNRMVKEIKKYVLKFTGMVLIHMPYFLLLFLIHIHHSKFSQSTKL